MSWARCRTKKLRRRKQVAGLALPLRVDVGQREHAAAEQGGELAGVDLVVLGLAAVDGLHVQGVAEDEGDVLLFAQVGAASTFINILLAPSVFPVFQEPLDRERAELAARIARHRAEAARLKALKESARKINSTTGRAD